MKTYVPHNREEYLIDILNNEDLKVGVEIGVFKGDFSKYLLNNWNGSLWMVDPWNTISEENYNDFTNHKYHQTAYLETMENIKGFEDRAFMLRGLSSDMASRFNNEELDFIYIDANHAYDYVKEDIKIWYPKLRRGGILSGHDYIKMDWYNDPNFEPNKKDKSIWLSTGEFSGIYGVNPAVDEFIEKEKLDVSITQEWFGTWVIKKP